MSEDDGPGGGESTSAVPATADGGIEAYETDHGIVLYDVNNPLAWIESSSPIALDDAV